MVKMKGNKWFGYMMSGMNILDPGTHPGRDPFVVISQEGMGNIGHLDPAWVW